MIDSRTRNDAQADASANSRSRPALSLRMERETITERQRAVCTLLQHPLLCASGPRAEEFKIVRRHAEWLRDWFGKWPGWRLTIHGESARLHKCAAEIVRDDRPARDPRSGTAFNRSRYALLCLLLATLEQEDRQTTLGQLADRVATTTAADSAFAANGFAFDLKNMDRRRDLVHVVRLLLHVGVLHRRHGDEEQFISHEKDVLYDISRPLLAATLSVKRGPSTVFADLLDERIAAIIEEPLPDNDDGRLRRLRSSVCRRLLDDPIVYYDDLTLGELEYLNGQRSRLMKEIGSATGMVPEVRREGIAVLDLRGDATDLGLPEEGTDGHVTLLVAEFLAGELRQDRTAVGRAEIAQRIADLIEQHQAHWRKDVRASGAAEALTDQVVERLASLLLVRRTHGGIRPLPAIARYAVAADEQMRLDFDESAETP